MQGDEVEDEDYFLRLQQLYYWEKSLGRHLLNTNSADSTSGMVSEQNIVFSLHCRLSVCELGMFDVKC